MPELIFGRKKNVFELALPFHYVSRVFGFGYFRIETTDKPFQTTILHTIWLILHILFWLCVATYWILILIFNEDDEQEQQQQQRHARSGFLSKVYFEIVVIQTLTSAAIILFNHVQRHHTYQFLASLHKFDERIQSLQWPHAFGRQSSFGYLIAMLTFVSSCFAFYMGIDAFHPTNKHVILLIAINNIIFVVVSCHYIFSVVCVIRRVKILTLNFS
jgi:hypothetical protein